MLGTPTNRAYGGKAVPFVIRCGACLSSDAAVGCEVRMFIIYHSPSAFRSLSTIALDRLIR